MMVSIHQPAYLPWLGYFARIAASDVHVVLDHVQFEKNSFINRNRVRAAQGACWLTVPVQTKGRFGRLPISAVRIDNSRDWRKQHWRTLAQSYSRSPHFAEHAAFFERVYARRWERLIDLCTEINAYLLRALHIDTPLRQASSLGASGVKDDLVLALCRACGATTYLSGVWGRDYLRVERFASAGVAVRFQDYVHPVYPQRGTAFEPNLSVVDLLFECGPASGDILRSAPVATR
jgi:hypothetical protein